MMAQMADTTTAAAPGTDPARTIRQALKAHSSEVRARFPALRHQNAIGVALMATAAAGMLGSGALYLAGVIPAWVCIPLAAVFASIAHELEHDLIHKMYFPRRQAIADAMLAIGWVLRPNTINPWMRRELHLLHHKIAGSPKDFEERAITNGEVMGPRRLLMIADSVAAVVLRRMPRAQKLGALKLIARAFFPIGYVHFAVWYTFVGYHGVQGASALMGAPLDPGAGVLAAMQVVDVLTVVWIAPNVLRSFCLNFISSNLHYFGDVEAGNVVQQTQVLNRWFFAPFHAFCMNFGSTHAIHHFWVPEPFYIRQLSAPVAHRVMRAHGVRFNDLGTFRRANRWAMA